MCDELKKAFFILEHGSYEGLPAYLKAIRIIKNEYRKMEKRQLKRRKRKRK